MGVMFKAAAIQTQNRLQAIALLEDMDARIAKAKSEGSTEVRVMISPCSPPRSYRPYHSAVQEADHLQNARGVYLEDAIESVRLTAWAQSTLFSAVSAQARPSRLPLFCISFH